MRNLKLVLAYDGSEFSGWQVQPDAATVQGTLASAIGRLTGEKVLPQGSGRTDAGVHALAQVAHLDVAIVCEAPKVNPRRDEMRKRIAEIAGISIDRVGVKATTNEKLGSLGREEGIAAYATATIRLPWSAP